jgi:hypothetical protein
MPDAWDSEAGQTHFVGDGWVPAQRVPDDVVNVPEESATVEDVLQAGATAPTTDAMPWLAQVPLRPVEGNEALHVGGQEFDGASAKVLEFWRWAYGDLRTNVTVGVLAEWIVARLLKLPTRTRPPYSTYDLVTPGGQRIEVKAAAYLQGWDQRRLSRITFSLSRTLPWEARTGFGLERVLHADWYVFCLQQCQDAANWDALDLDQWTFLLLSRAEIGSFGQKQKTIALARLQAVTARLTAQELREQGLKRIEHESPNGPLHDAVTPADLGTC